VELIVQTLTTLGIGSILVIVTGTFLKWYFERKAREHEAYLKGFETVKDYCTNYYSPIAVWSYYLYSALKDASKLEKRSVVLALYQAARLFQKWKQFFEEAGYVFKLRDYSDENVVGEIWNRAYHRLPFDTYSRAVLVKYIEPKTPITDFLSNIEKPNQFPDLAKVYDTFENWLRTQKDDVNEVQKNLRILSEYLDYQVRQMFKIWYRKRYGILTPEPPLSSKCKEYIKEVRKDVEKKLEEI